MKDADLMALADGELDERETREIEDALGRDPSARGKIEALGELGELVRGHLELSADAVPQKKIDALWREIDKGIARAKDASPAKESAKTAPAEAGVLRRVGRWFDAHRGHIISGVVGAGAVAALALVLRDPTTTTTGTPSAHSHPIDTMTVSMPAEIDSLDTPGGTGTVFNLNDEDGDTTVIWVTPEDTVEGI